MKQKVIIRGPILTTSGYGVFSRVVLDSLLMHEDLFDLYVMPTAWGNTTWLWEDNYKRALIDDLCVKTNNYLQMTQGNPDFDLSLQVTIPNEWQPMAKQNIGVCAGIETTKVSLEWLQKANTVVDKVIVISDFAKSSFVRTMYDVQAPNGEVVKYKLVKPIEVIGCPVHEYSQIDLPIKLKHDFNFLNVCQWGPRKNVESLVKWFVEEFHDDEVGLVCKTFAMNNSIPDRLSIEKRTSQALSEFPNRKCSVTLLHGDFTDQEMNSLYRHPKIKGFVTIAAAEGLCLPMLEAASQNLPVVAPEYGGYLDFMTMTDDKGNAKSMFSKVDFDLGPIPKEAHWEGVLVPDSMWTYSKKSSLKSRLRDLYKDYGRFKSQAKKLGEHVRATWTPESIAKQYCDIVNTKLDVGAMLKNMNL